MFLKCFLSVLSGLSVIEKSVCFLRGVRELFAVGNNLWSGGLEGGCEGVRVETYLTHLTT